MNVGAEMTPAIIQSKLILQMRKLEPGENAFPKVIGAVNAWQY